MVIWGDGDASLSVGSAFALLVNFLSESVNDIPALRVLEWSEDCEGEVLKGSTLVAGDFVNDGDIDNKLCSHLSACETSVYHTQLYVALAIC